MRIGFDASQTGRSKAGCGFVAASLASEFARMETGHEFVVYPVFGDLYWDADWRNTLLPDARGFRRGPGFEGHEEARRFWRTPPEDFERRLESPDLIHCNNFYCPPGGTRAALVYTVHDLEFCTNPEWTEEMNRLGCFEGVARASAFADRVIAISDYTRGSFLRLFPHYAPERVVTAPLASRFPLGGTPRRPASKGIEPGRYLLGVSTLEPRKNTARIVRAYARFADGLEAPPALVLAGKRGWGNEDLDRALEENAGKRIVFAGYVTDAELEWLYRNCAAFVFPSLAEGFGLPLLEAMSLGAACLTARGTATEEVAGGAALLVEAEDTEAIAEGMRRLWTDKAAADRLREEGLERAKGYSWRSTASRVLEVYRELAAERGLR